MEALDKNFENICELDLIFHSQRVHYVLNEIVMGEMVLKTNIINVMNSLLDQKSYGLIAQSRKNYAGWR